MRNTTEENVAEHALTTAYLAHALAVISREICGTDASPEQCAVNALFHDSAEIFTGDLPTPVKYWSPAIRDAYREVEEHSVSRLLALLPPKLRPAMEGALTASDEHTERIVRAADKLSAHLKCLEELRNGNREFAQAAAETRKKLDEMKMEEIKYFVENFLPAFSLTLDEMQ
jgi:5'-deoxynucleotidase